jgi:hypothetical protein
MLWWWCHCFFWVLFYHDCWLNCDGQNGVCICYLDSESHEICKLCVNCHQNTLFLCEFPPKYSRNAILYFLFCLLMKPLYCSGALQECCSMARLWYCSMLSATPSVPNYYSFWLFYIHNVCYVDALYIYIYIKNYVSRKAKTNSNLGRRCYYLEN